MHDIEKIELVWWDGSVYSVQPGAVSALSGLLSAGLPVKGGAGCPFHSVLYLYRTDGIVGKLLPAEDSCTTYLSGDECYDYRLDELGDNADFYQFFNVNAADLPIYQSIE